MIRVQVMQAVVPGRRVARYAHDYRMLGWNQYRGWLQQGFGLFLASR